jgi:2-C-methyl-D-erythritol 4-phosphate cytidylyltransferase/2-C-methyl-D-erythritol 2,4-cyclodiphosphate synthase
MADCVAVIVCAGKGERTGLPYNKIFYEKQGKTVLEHCLEKFDCPKIIVAAQNDLEKLKEITKNYKDVKIVLGGDTRTRSVKAGLSLAQEYKYVLIHDGARPNISKNLIKKLIQTCKEYGSAIPYTSVKDTIIQKNQNSYTAVDRKNLMAIQTPQVFETQKITRAYADISEELTDDSQVYSIMWGNCTYIEGEDNNYKITTSQDLLMFSEKNSFDYRTGLGYDFHKLTKDRRLILGGVYIPYELGLLGHSDADVLVHALMDSMLSALGERDIGCFFPDNDNTYKDISSLTLLEKVCEILKQKNADINNVSLTVIAEKPKLSPYIAKMKENIASVLGITSSQIGITVTTNEGCGTIGRGEGIAAMCVCQMKL